MKVTELIDLLEDLPLYADVHILFDGDERGDVDCVFLAKNGMVMVASENEPIYGDEARPVKAPTESDDPNYRTKKLPGNE